MGNGNPTSVCVHVDGNGKGNATHLNRFSPQGT